MKKKRRLGYIIFTVSIVFLMLCITHFVKGINAAENDKLRVEFSGTFLNGYHTSDETQIFINNCLKNPELVKQLFDEEEMKGTNRSFSNELIKKLGLENMNQYYENSFFTEEGCHLFRLEKTTNFNLQWTNELENGTVRLVLMKLDGTIVYEDNKSNISYQMKLELAPGEYFVFAEINTEAKGYVKNNFRLEKILQ